MDSTKRYEAFNDPKLSSQQAIASLMNTTSLTPERHVIPGGKELTTIMKSKEVLSKAIYNWLRAKTHFKEFYLSFAKDPDQFSTSETKVENFATTLQPIWQMENGKLKLANTLADILTKQKLLALRVKTDGIYITKDKSNKFSQTTVVTQADLDAGEYAGAEVGQKVISKDWEPWYGITSSRRTSKPIRRDS